MHMTLGEEGDYTDFIPFQQSLFFTKADPTNRIETGLLCLLILIDLIKGRDDLVYNVLMINS